MITREYKADCGVLLIGVQGKSVCLCDWMREGRIEKTLGRFRKYKTAGERDDSSLIDSVKLQLDEYFKGKRKEFELPLNPVGTEFQRQVWRVLTSIPYGTTITYKEIADSLARSTSVRAVANAIGANPISIIIPCHRVVGSDGSLTGYAGGLEAKRKLLALERILTPPVSNGFSL